MIHSLTLVNSIYTPFKRMKRMKKVVFCSVLWGLLMAPLAACSGGSKKSSNLPPGDATYRVTFKATWSAQTHPTQFPPNSSLFRACGGGFHNDQALLWERGSAASGGMESMAETGSQSLLLQEVEEFDRPGEGFSEAFGLGVVNLSRADSHRVHC